MKLKSRRCKVCKDTARLAKTKGRKPRWLCVECYYRTVECREPKEETIEEDAPKTSKKNKAQRHG